MIRLLFGLLLIVWVQLPAAPARAAEWLLPLAGESVVTRPFEPPRTPYGRGHRGVDLAGSAGQQVRAAGSGTVGFAGPLAGRGVVTVLHAGGLRTTYEPVGASVHAGEAVAAGDPIGTLDTGHAGCPVAACLHWGLLRGEEYLDPMSLLGLGPIRLLPSGSEQSGSQPAGEEGSAAAASAGAHAAAGAGPPLPDDDRIRTLAPWWATLATGMAAGVAIVLVRARPP